MTHSFRTLACLMVAAAFAACTSTQKATSKDDALTAAYASMTVPHQDLIIANIKPTHPRVLIDETTFPRIKEQMKTSPLMAKWYAGIKKEADDLLTRPVVDYRLSEDRSNLLSVSRRTVDRVFTLAAAYKIEGDKRYVDRLYAELEAIAAFPDWHPPHFLDTAEMALAFGIAYDWLYNDWTEAQREVIKQAIIEKALIPGRDGYTMTSPDIYFAWMTNNWNQVCNGGLGIAALAIAEGERPLMSRYIVKEAVLQLPRAMIDYSPDGAWNEGPGYWNYATSYNVLFIAALDSALGTDYGLAALPGFGSTGDVPLYMTGYRGLSFDFSDSHPGRMYGSQMFWLGQRFHKPQYVEYQKKTPRASVLDLIWYDPEAPDFDLTTLPLDHRFRGTEFISMRSSWTDPDATIVALTSGPNETGHAQLDLGSFILDAKNERWIMDLGGENYSVPSYFDSRPDIGTRWTYYRCRAEGHNTLVINPSMKPDQDPLGTAVVKSFESTPNRVTAACDLTPAYKPSGAKSVVRTFEFVDRERLKIHDEIKLDEPGDVWWFAHTEADIDVAPGKMTGGWTVRFKLNGKTMTAHIKTSPDAEVSVMPAAPLPGTPHPDRNDPNKGVRKLAIHFANVQSVDLTVVFLP